MSIKKFAMLLKSGVMYCNAAEELSCALSSPHDWIESASERAVETRGKSGFRNFAVFNMSEAIIPRNGQQIC